MARIANAFILLTFVLALTGMLLHPGSGQAVTSYFDVWLVQIIRFSVTQALLSALISILLALPIAYGLSLRPFAYDWLIKALLNWLFILPVLAVVLAVIAQYSTYIDIFGLQGILIAHAYLNMPFAIRFFWERFEQVSSNHLKIANHFGLHGWNRLRWLYWPIALKASASVFSIIFLFCFSSFTVVLTLGGGPANTNLEVAIYQALKYDFDPRASFIYASVHLAIALAIVFVCRPQFLYRQSAVKQKRQKNLPNAAQGLILLLLALFFLSPIVQLLQRALTADWNLPTRFLEAISTSLVIGFFSALTCLSIATMKALDSARKSVIDHTLDYGLLIVPTMVVATGLFLLALVLGIAFQLTYLLIIWLNALMAMPLLVPIIHQRIATMQIKYQCLLQLYDMKFLHRWQFIYWPAIRPVVPWCFSLAMMLSIGDLGIAALVGSADFVTLPILIYQAMGSYQMALAMQLTLILLAISALLLVLGEWIGDKRYA